MKILPVMCVVAVTISAVVAAPQAPQFDVATVKRLPPVQPGELLNINLGAVRNGTVTLSNVTLAECIQFAYGLVSAAQLSGPDWIRSRDVRFEVVAKTLADKPQAEILVMMQTLLAERLNVQIHHEKRELPHLELIVAKNGPKLSPAKSDGERPPQIAGRIVHPQMPMSLLASLLSRFERQTVIDATGLKGPFAVDLRWTPDMLRTLVSPDAGPPLVNGQSVDVTGPSLYTALQEQLGLRLESKRGLIDVLVVDRADKIPADN